MRAEAACALSGPPAPADRGRPVRRKIRALRLRTPGRWDAGRPKHVRNAPRGGPFATARRRLQGRLCYTREFFPKAYYGVPPSLINALDFLASEWPKRRQARELRGRLRRAPSRWRSSC